MSSQWAEFLQHLSCLVPWFGNVLSFKRSMRKTLQNTLIMDNIWNVLASNTDRQLTFRYLRVQQKPVTSRIQRKATTTTTNNPSIPSHTPPPPLSDSHQKAVLCELLTANVLSFYHLLHFCLSVRGQWKQSRLEKFTYTVRTQEGQSPAQPVKTLKEQLWKWGSLSTHTRHT